MSRLRLTGVADTTRSKRDYWNRRCDEKWGSPFHGHFLDPVEVVEQMDKVNFEVIMSIARKLRISAGNEKKQYSVLEMACGIGRYTEVLLQWFDKYVGVDFATKNIEEANALNTSEEATFHCADMLEFKTDEKFDLIFMVAAMSSIEESSQEIVDHLSTMLKPGGCIAIFEQELYMVKWR